MGAGKPIPMAGNKLAAPRTQGRKSDAGFSSYNRNLQAKQKQAMQDTQNQNTPMRRLEMPENKEFAYNGPDPVYDQRRAKEVGPAYREAYMREIDKAMQDTNPMRRLEIKEFAYNGPDPVYDQRRAEEVGPAYREAYMREIDKAAQKRDTRA